jgi:hypothetical protein
MRTETEQASEHPGVGGIRVRVSFDEHGLRLEHTPFGLKVSLDGCRPAGQPGGPALPRSVIRVALPPFHWTASVELREEQVVRVTKEATLVAPVQTPRAGVGGDDDDRDRDDHDKDDDEQHRHHDHDHDRDDRRDQIKRSSLRRPRERFVEPFPTPPVLLPDPALYERARDETPRIRHVSTDHIGIVPVATIEVNPVTYAEDGSLVLATSIDLEVTHVDVRDIPKEIRLDPAEQERLGLRTDRIVPMQQPPVSSEAQASRLYDITQSMVVNAEDVWDYRLIYPRFELPADHLIITDNNTWDRDAISATGATDGDLVAAFRRLSSWKASRGVSSKIVTVSDIVGGRYGDFRSGSRDLQEVLRKFVRWAKENWGVCWLLLGGDVEIIPPRTVAGQCRGHIGTGTDDPPKDNASFWTGSYLKMKVVSAGDWWSASTDNLLVRPDTGQVIPYDSTGSATFGWHFCTDDTYATSTAAVTQFVRVNGSADVLNATLQWLYHWNQIPTDFYYSSLYCWGIAYQTIDMLGVTLQYPYVFEPDHHWDLVENQVYGQYHWGNDLDGVIYHPDVSVGRAAVSSGADADAFVDKVIAYESFRAPDGGLLDFDWPSRVVIASTDWGGPVGVSNAWWNWPADNTYHHESGDDFTLIKTADVLTNIELIAEISGTDRRVLPHLFTGGSNRGWYYVNSDIDPTPSVITHVYWWGPITLPVPTNWIRVQGTADELEPGQYVLDDPNQDGSMSDQEQLRMQLAAELPGLNNVSRYYEDELDLTWWEAVAAPIQHLTSSGLEAALDSGPHIVSLSGHGNPGGCCGGNPWMAAGLTNGYESFIGYADSCLTNAFDETDSFSESLLDNGGGGAVAYVGNTRFSWIGDGDNFQRAFFHRLTTTQHLGLLNDSRCDLLNDTSIDGDYARWIIFSLNLLGDPEMPVRRGRYRWIYLVLAEAIDRRIPIDIKVYAVEGPIHVPVGGATVHLSQEGFSQLATTDADGACRFDVSLASLGDLIVTVSGDQLIPQVVTVPVTGPDWVTGRVIEVSHQEGSPHRTLVRLRGQEGEPDGVFFARDDVADYVPILDAVNDAYVSKTPISLFVASTRDGGTIERFRFLRRQRE